MNTGEKSQDLELSAQMSSSFPPQSLRSFHFYVYENSPAAAQETFLLTTQLTRHPSTTGVNAGCQCHSFHTRHSGPSASSKPPSVVVIPSKWARLSPIRCLRLASLPCRLWIGTWTYTPPIRGIHGDFNLEESNTIRSQHLGSPWPPAGEDQEGGKRDLNVQRQQWGMS